MTTRRRKVLLALGVATLLALPVGWFVAVGPFAPSPLSASASTTPIDVQVGPSNDDLAVSASHPLHAALIEYVASWSGQRGMMSIVTYTPGVKVWVGDHSINFQEQRVIVNAGGSQRVRRKTDRDTAFERDIRTWLHAQPSVHASSSEEQQ